MPVQEWHRLKCLPETAVAATVAAATDLVSVLAGVACGRACSLFATARVVITHVNVVGDRTDRFIPKTRSVGYGSAPLGHQLSSFFLEEGGMPALSRKKSLLYADPKNHAGLPPDSPSSQEAVSVSQQARPPINQQARQPLSRRACAVGSHQARPASGEAPWGASLTRGRFSLPAGAPAYQQARQPPNRRACAVCSQQNRPSAGRLRRQAGLPAEFARLLPGDRASQEGDRGSCPCRPALSILRASQRTGLSRDAAFLPIDRSACRQPFEASQEGGLAARLPGSLESRRLPGCGNSLPADASACQEGFGLPGGRPTGRLFCAS